MSERSMELKGKVAWVTGGAGAVGAAVCAELARMRARRHVGTHACEPRQGARADSRVNEILMGPTLNSAYLGELETLKRPPPPP